MKKQKAVMRIRTCNKREHILELETTENPVFALIGDVVDFCNKKHGGYIQIEVLRHTKNALQASCRRTI